MKHHIRVSAIAALLAAASWSGAAEPGPSPFERDRRAILAMAGRYRVEFNFTETVAFLDGYTLAAPQRSRGTELVVVAEDAGRAIELQHILVLGEKKEVVKHWRQRWEFENRDLLEFRGRRTFAPRRLDDAEARGAWTQAVFEVDDAPRYQGYGRWRHEGGVSCWESKETWRPLPRREHTKRSDYDVIVARNRHTLMPAGWVHEQDNLKVKLGAPNVALARETGLNRYTRIDDWDFSAGESYWKDTQGFWRDVRQAWATLLARGPSVVEEKAPEGAARYESLFALAAEVRKGGTYRPGTMRARVAEVLSRFVHPPASGASVAGRLEGTGR